MRGHAGRLLGPGPNPGHHILVLGVSVTHALILVHDPAHARAPHRTLRVPGGTFGPDPTFGATVGMILGTADLARLIPKTHDGQELNYAPPVFCYASKPFLHIRCRPYLMITYRATVLK